MKDKVRFEKFIRSMTEKARTATVDEDGVAEWEWTDGTSMRPAAVAWFAAYDEVMARQGWRWNDQDPPPPRTAILVIVATNDGASFDVFFPTDPCLPARYLWHHAPKLPAYELLLEAARVVATSWSAYEQR